jgi:DNA helicase-2/ATP-dependent DNA helicase PcrA
MHSLSREVESCLVRAGIPYQMARGTAFYNRLEVRDVLAYAQFIANGDRLAFQRIANVPKRGIGKKTLERILEAAGEGNVLEWLQGFYQAGQGLALSEAKPSAWKALATRQGLQVSGGYAQRVWELAQIVIDLRRQLEAGATVTDLLKGIIEIAKPYWEGLKNPQERIENATELLTVAGRTETPGLDGLQEFLEGVALVGRADDIEESGGVTLATLHAAKGLEWDVVLIIGVEDELIPHRRSVAETGNDEEERRLFYVGVTRARQACYCLGAQRRALFGEVTDHAPSPFLTEMGIDVEAEMNWEDLLGGWEAPI